MDYFSLSSDERLRLNFQVIEKMKAMPTADIYRILNAALEEHRKFAAWGQEWVAKYDEAKSKNFTTAKKLAVYVLAPGGGLLLNRKKVKEKQKESDNRWIELEQLTKNGFAALRFTNIFSLPDGPTQNYHCIQMMVDAIASGTAESWKELSQIALDYYKQLPAEQSTYITNTLLEPGTVEILTKEAVVKKINESFTEAFEKLGIQ